MEVYYKDLISEDASLEKLVEDLSRVVQGAEEFAAAAHSELPHVDINPHLERLKEGCRRVREHAISGAVATDKVLRRNPYSFASIAFAFGILAGVMVCRSLSRKTGSESD